MSNSNSPFESVNPYATPISDGRVLKPSSEAARIRKEHIRHEASIKSIGTLYLLGSFITIILSIVLFGIAISTVMGRTNSITSNTLSVTVVGVGFAVFWLASGILNGATALGLFKLKPWSRVVAIVLSVIGLLAIPIGTIISAYFLYLLLSQKGVYIFSDEYKKIVAQTPHIRYKTSKVVWFFFGLLVILILAACLGAFLTPRPVRT